MEYECREEIGKYINPDNRIIARTTDADFYLITHRNAPKGADRFEIQSRSKNVSLSLSADSSDHAIDSLRQWAADNKRCLLTYCKYDAGTENNHKNKLI